MIVDEGKFCDGISVNNIGQGWIVLLYQIVLPGKLEHSST